MVPVAESEQVHPARGVDLAMTPTEAILAELDAQIAAFRDAIREVERDLAAREGALNVLMHVRTRIANGMVAGLAVQP